MVNITVSICCITYNHAKFIKQCLDGFLMQQTNFEYEILIHDDASDDGTQDIIKKYQEKYPEIIKPIYQKENQYSQGISRFNTKYNFPRAKGIYIATCEGDDYWTDPLKLQKQVDFLEANPAFILTHHKFNNVDLNGKLMSSSIKPLLCTVLFRNDIADMPYTDECPNGDRLIFTYFSLKGSFKYLDDILPSVRRHHPAGVMSMKSLDEKLQRQAKTWTIIYETFKHTKLGKKLYFRKNIFTYRKMLLDWEKGDISLLKLLFYPIKNRHLKLYNLLFKKLMKKLV